MKKTIMTLTAITFLAGGVQANTFALDITNGSETFLVNTGTEPLEISAYMIVSDSGGLQSAAWNSIADQIAGPGGMDLIADLGIGVAGFCEANPADGHVCEVNLAFAIWPAGYSLSIGQVWPRANAGDLEFTYVTKQYGESACLEGEIIPEPGTLTLLAMGGLAICRRSRRG